MKTYTENELKEMKFQELIKTAKDLGIKYKLQKKDVLIAMIIEKQGGTVSEEQVSSVKPVKTAKKTKEQTKETTEETGEAAEEVKETVEETGEAAEEVKETVEETGETVEEVEKVVEKTVKVAKKIAKAAKKTAKKVADEEDDVRARKRIIKSKEEKRSEILDNLTKEQRDIFEDDTLAKSEKMRRLFKKGLSIAQISHLMNTHYSFTFGVISRFKKFFENPKSEKSAKTAEKEVEEKEEVPVKSVKKGKK